MSLPFIKPKQAAGIIIKRRKPDESSEVTSEQAESPLQYCAEEILRAIEESNAKSLAVALEDAFEILKSQDMIEPEEIS